MTLGLQNSLNPTGGGTTTVSDQTWRYNGKDKMVRPKDKLIIKDCYLNNHFSYSRYKISVVYDARIPIFFTTAI